MFVPLIIDPCAFYDYRYLWEYLKYLYHSYENNWSIIASYEFEKYRDHRPKSNVYEKEFSTMHQYRVLNEEEEKTVAKYFVDKSIFEQLKAKLGSDLAVKIFLLQKRYKPLEKCLKKIIAEIQKNEKIEGFITWNAHFKSIDIIAKKMNVPVITNEFTIRMPEFRPLSFFCEDDLYGSSELEKGYQKFVKCDKKFELFSRKELLALFLSDKRIEELLNEIDPCYEIGIAGCHPLIATYFSKSMYTDLELIQDVRNQYAEKDILFRMHPGDEPYQARYTLENLDDSEYASQFIKKCKRIVAQGSNIILEAMLWGKQVYSHDISPFNFLCENDLGIKDGGYVDDSALNYILLGALVPYEKICDVEYIRWRLCEGNIYCIYEENVKYYFDYYHIPYTVLSLPQNERFGKILEYRGIKI